VTPEEFLRQQAEEAKSKQAGNGHDSDHQDDRHDSDHQDDNAWTFPDPEIIRDKLSLRGWLERDVKPPDCLMGEWFTTTSRVELVAPTGLGKTNLALALAAFGSVGLDFLHWRGCGKPRRWLYVDGEMSERLMRSRLEDAVRRLLGEITDTLFILSRQDFPEMPPLNIEEGQKFIDHFIASVGGVDAVVFDNIQALCVGIMKEEESWQPMLPWIRELTQQKIGQIWVHHTGHNETHGYGTSTREWQLDTVMLLERVERQDAVLSFLLKFKKARERTPDNWTEFEDATITLADDEWSSVKGTNVPTGPRTAADRALDLLQEAIIHEGEIPAWNKHIPPDTLCVTEKKWREYCEKGFLTDGSPDPAKKVEADRKAFQRVCKNLIGTRVGKWDSWVWIYPRKQAAATPDSRPGQDWDIVPDMSRPFVRS
jgi:hypothetical protein